MHFTIELCNSDPSNSTIYLLIFGFNSRMNKQTQLWGVQYVLMKWNQMINCLLWQCPLYATDKDVDSCRQARRFNWHSLLYVLPSVPHTAWWILVLSYNCLGNVVWEKTRRKKVTNLQTPQSIANGKIFFSHYLHVIWKNKHSSLNFLISKIELTAKSIGGYGMSWPWNFDVNCCSTDEIWRRAFIFTILLSMGMLLLVLLLWRFVLPRRFKLCELCTVANKCRFVVVCSDFRRSFAGAATACTLNVFLWLWLIFRYDDRFDDDDVGAIIEMILSLWSCVGWLVWWRLLNNSTSALICSEWGWFLWWGDW